MSGLSAFQTEVAKVFVSLPESKGFLLAGGGALLASGLSTEAPAEVAETAAESHSADTADSGVDA